MAGTCGSMGRQNGPSGRVICVITVKLAISVMQVPEHEMTTFWSPNREPRNDTIWVGTGTLAVLVDGTEMLSGLVKKAAGDSGTVVVDPDSTL